jgi:hypothetical protein
VSAFKRSGFVFGEARTATLPRRPPRSSRHYSRSVYLVRRVGTGYLLQDGPVFLARKTICASSELMVQMHAQMVLYWKPALLAPSQRPTGHTEDKFCDRTERAENRSNLHWTSATSCGGLGFRRFVEALRRSSYSGARVSADALPSKSTRRRLPQVRDRSRASGHPCSHLGMR